MNDQNYLTYIQDKVVLPGSLSHFEGYLWMFHQDSVPAHSIKAFQQQCSPQFPNFISPQGWPCCSPDLNPLNSSMLPVLESRASATPHKNSNSLQHVLPKVWDEINDRYLPSTVDAFLKHLKVCTKSKEQSSAF